MRAQLSLLCISRSPRVRKKVARSRAGRLFQGIKALLAAVIAPSICSASSSGTCASSSFVAGFVTAKVAPEDAQQSSPLIKERVWGVFIVHTLAKIYATIDAKTLFYYRGIFPYF